MNPISLPGAPHPDDARTDLPPPPELPLATLPVAPAAPLSGEQHAPAYGTATETVPLEAAALADCAQRIRDWGRELGFSAVGISDTDLQQAEAGFNAWLAAGYHGEMDYMAKHGTKRTRPAELVPGTLRVISVRLPYLPATLFASAAPSTQAVAEMAAQAGPTASSTWRSRELARLDDPTTAIVSVYARGRDYHKVMRQRLQKLADRITAEIGAFGYRVFTDSAPVLEVELARKALLGWRGKHTLLLDQYAGSLFFLGEIYVDLPLPTDAIESRQQPQLADALFDSVPETLSDAQAEAPQVDTVEAPPGELVAEDGAHCGSCTRCIAACPTGAIVGPYRVDARRCISYLTIELKGSIPLELRPLIGNRVYGCDDCQLVCPWNKFAQPSGLDDFDVRNGLDRASLLELFAWSAEQFDTRLAGSAIRRIGHERWLRNIAVALGNALRGPLDEAVRQALVAGLQARLDDVSALVREHVAWALSAE